MSVPPAQGGWLVIGGTGDCTATIGPGEARTGVNFGIYRIIP